jgi:hypothetical protein
MKSRPILIGNSILAGLQVLTSAAALSDAIGTTAFGLFSIAVASVTIGFNTYAQGVVVPTTDVGAYTNAQGTMVSGPASGVTNGKEVEVVPTSPSF